MDFVTVFMMSSDYLSCCAEKLRIAFPPQPIISEGIFELFFFNISESKGLELWGANYPSWGEGECVESILPAGIQDSHVAYKYIPKQTSKKTHHTDNFNSFPVSNTTTFV